MGMESGLVSDDATSPPVEPADVTLEPGDVTEDTALALQKALAPHYQESIAQSNNATFTQLPLPPPPLMPPPEICQICGEGDSPCKRLCFFRPNAWTNSHTIIHVFCGKTAAILPKINRPDLEILTRSGIKNKHGTGSDIVIALQRARQAVVTDGNRKQVYYLHKEVQDHVQQLQQQQAMLHPSFPAHHMPSTYAPPTYANTLPAYKDPRPSNSIMQQLKTVKPPEIAPPEPPRPPIKRFKPSPEMSPYEVLMGRLQETSDRVGGVGYSLVRGVSPAQSEGDYDEENEDIFDPTRCSQQQVNHVRILIVTAKRQEYMEHFSRQISHHPDNPCQQVFDTWRVFSQKYRNLKKWSCKFDMLLGFTDAIRDNHEWMTATNDDVGSGEINRMVGALGRLWKTILRKTNPRTRH